MATLKYFVIDLFGSFAKWPVWWYTSGLILVAKILSQIVAGYSRQLAVGVWARNLFIPMFGQSDWQGRIISFMMRVVQIIGRSIFVVVLGFSMVFVLIAYIALPAVALFGLFFQIFGNLIAS